MFDLDGQAGFSAALDLASQRLLAPETDVFAELGYTPHEQQRKFHESTEDEVLYGGSAGGGKSVAIVLEGLRACALYPGMRVLLVRRSYDELAESIFPVLAKFGYAAQLGARWNGTDRELKFPNRSLFRFRYMENLADASRRQGGEYQLLLVDEATLMPPGVVDILKYERLRAGNDVPVLGTRLTCNPGGPSHAQVKARYIDGTAHGTRISRDEQGLTVRFIQAKATDNPHLDTGYSRRLDAIPDPQRRAAMRDGDWDQFAGMMFAEWRRERHVIDPIALPAGWARYNGIDWGYTAPWCVLWGAVDEDGRVWVYREIYRTQVGESDQAKQILEAETANEHVIARYADDAMWATRGDAKAISTVYAENGAVLTAAGKGGRVAGWQRVHTFLREAPACPHHRAQGWATCPMLHVFSTCTDLLRTLPALPRATTGDPEDADGKAEDHACLVAGTLIETSDGPAPIETVRPGDLVWTRAGLRCVVASGITADNATVGSVLMSNGSVITGTANHPVWVAEKGWTPLSKLQPSDILEPWQTVKLCCSTASSSADTQTRNGDPTASTSRQALAIRNAASDAFTRKYGKLPTGQYLMGITSTTRTAIRSTTRSTTSSASRASTTCTTTSARSITTLPSASPTWSGSGPSLPSGIGLLQAANGTANTQSRWPRTAAQKRESATTAARTTRATTWGTPSRSAPTTASTVPDWRLGSTTRTALASSAATPSGSTSTSGSAAVPVRVVRAFRGEPNPSAVYNLQIDGAHEFYANGVLVHNCDSLRYMLLNIGGGPQFPNHDVTVPAEDVGGLPILEPLGAFAVRDNSRGEPDWWLDADAQPETVNRIAQTGTAPWH